MKYLSIIVLAVIVLFVLTPLVPALGQINLIPGVNSPTAQQYNSGSGGSSATVDVTGIIKRITDLLFVVVIALAVPFIIYAAFLYLTSAGGEKVQTANKIILYTVVAIVVASVSKIIVSVARYIAEG